MLRGLSVIDFPKELEDIAFEYFSSRTLSDKSIAVLKEKVPLFAERPMQIHSIFSSLLKNESVSRKTTGNQLISYFIENLRPGRNWGLESNDFSREKFNLNVLDLLIELVETAEQNLSSDGTYRSVVDVSLEWADHIDQALKRGKAVSPKVRAKIIQLNQAINHELQYRVGRLSYDSFRNCNFLFDLDPKFPKTK
jgi:hypothetical protein